MAVMLARSMVEISEATKNFSLFPAATAIQPMLARHAKVSARKAQMPMPTLRAGFQP